MKSVQHHYAKTAYESIMKVKNKPFEQQYGQLCHRFPALVLTNGLRLAVAFLQSKGKESAYTLYLQHMGQAVDYCFAENKICVLDQNTEYLHLSKKVLSASAWFKRYAEAFLAVDQTAESKLLNEERKGEEGAREVQA